VRTATRLRNYAFVAATACVFAIVCLFAIACKLQSAAPAAAKRPEMEQEGRLRSLQSCSFVVTIFE
jgi:hypothetical protein